MRTVKIFLSKILKKSQKNVRNRIQFQSLYTVVCSQCPPEIHLFKVNNGSTKTMSENSSKLTIKTPEQHHWHRSDVFIDNFEHISPIALVFLFFDFEQMSAKYGVRLLALTHSTETCFNFQLSKDWNPQKLNFLGLFRKFQKSHFKSHE